MYYKQSTGVVIVRKSIDNASWVKWVHHSQGPNCCQECLKLDGCLFLESRAPIWPHHPNCHCTLDPVDHSTVLLVAAAQSDYGKLILICLIRKVDIPMARKSFFMNGDIL